jgi:integrase
MSAASSQDAVARATRHPVRGHRGISYRERAGGSRTYFVFFDGQYRRAGKTLQEALTMQGDLRAKKGRGERTAVPAKKTVAELAAEWLDGKTRLAPWTRKTYEDALRLVLLPTFGDWQVKAVDAEAVARLIRGLEAEGLRSIDPKRMKRPLSPSAIGNYLQPLGGMMSLALRRGYVTENPCRLLTADERPRQRHVGAAHEWSDEEIDALLEASALLARQPEARQDYTSLLRTAVYTGLRLGELLGLQWQDVELDEAVLHVRRQWTRTHELAEPKTRSGLRRVPLSPDMVAELRRHKLASEFSQETDFVFASHTGGALRHRNVQRRAFERARDLAGLPSTLTFHDLRHAFASLAAHSGVPIHTVSAVLGHRDISVTQKVYLHLWDRESAEDAFRAAMNGGAHLMADKFDS